ncbi:hypothetical protein ACMFMG_011797 [Clarireedia jacksonii]
MVRWYQNAARCYIYLSDVSKPDTDWTLQELIAPRLVDFFSSEGTLLGNKLTLESKIHEITGIANEALRGNTLSNFSIEEDKIHRLYKGVDVEPFAVGQMSSNLNTVYPIQDADSESTAPFILHPGLENIAIEGGQGKVIAVVRRNPSASQDKLAQKEFLKTRRPGLQAEANTLFMIDQLGLRRHKVKLEGAYSINDERHFLVISPFANSGNLWDMLRNVYCSEAPCTEAKITILRKAMGCLAVGLAELHHDGQRNFRHRDIHPKNVLLHNGEVLYCDFGASLQFEPGDATTTTTRRPPMMKRYAAPEVLSPLSDGHNKKTDVFSLGAVLYEIYWAIIEPSFLETPLSDAGWRYGAGYERCRWRWYFDITDRHESYHPLQHNNGRLLGWLTYLPNKFLESIKSSGNSYSPADPNFRRMKNPILPPIQPKILEHRFSNGIWFDDPPFAVLPAMLCEQKRHRPSALKVAASIYVAKQKYSSAWMCSDCKTWLEKFGNDEIQDAIGESSRRLDMIVLYLVGFLGMMPAMGAILSYVGFTIPGFTFSHFMLFWIAVLLLCCFIASLDR